MAELLATNPSVALLGPRQVGKTTLAHLFSEELDSVYLDLENRIDLQTAKEIELFHSINKENLIILDEVQGLPEIFAPIRGLIDQERRTGRKNGNFLFLGSASIDLLQQSSETLAGRIAYLELYPINVLEFTQDMSDLKGTSELWLRGGFPESLLAKLDYQSLDWRQNFIRTYLERDIPKLGPRIPAETLERFWTMLAHDQGSTMNASKMGSNLDVSSVTVSRYLDLLVDLLLIRKVRPFSTNVRKRVVKSPRIYVRDTGLVHALLNIGTYKELLGHPVVGKSWEGFVIENIASMLPPRANIFYYRTTAGAEIDLIIEFGPDECWAIEIKKGTSFRLARGFYEACKDINPTKKYLIHTTGGRRIPLSNGVEALSLYEFLEILVAKSNRPS